MHSDEEGIKVASIVREMGCKDNYKSIMKTTKHHKAIASRASSMRQQ
jgi:hypothetical protein